MSSTYKSAMRQQQQQQQNAEDSTEGVPAPPRSASAASSSAVPSRDSVSAAIALVRAKQAAKAGNHHTVHKVNNLDELKMLRVSNKVTSAQMHLMQQQQKHRTLQERRKQQESPVPQSENSTPKAPGDAAAPTTKVSIVEAGSSEDHRSPLSPRATQDKKPDPAQQKQRHEVSGTLFSMVNDVFSSRSETQTVATSKRSAPARKAVDEDTFDPFDQTDFANMSNTRKVALKAAASYSKRSKEEMSRSAPALADSTSTLSLPSVPSGKSRDDDEQEPSGLSRSDSDDDDLPEVDEKTMADVNAFLNKLGVRPSTSKDNSVTDSIEKMRSLSSDDSSSIGEVEPETMEEISAFIDNISRKGQESAMRRLTAEEQRLARQAEEKKRQAQLAEEAASKAYEELNRVEAQTSMKRHLGDAPSTVAEEKKVDDEPVIVKRRDDSGEAEVQARTSRPSPIYELMEEASQPHVHGIPRDPPSTLPYEGPVRKADPPGPPTPPSPASMSDTELSQAVMQMHQEGEEMIAPSYSVESLDSSPPVSVALEEEKKSEDDDDDMDDETYSEFIDTSFAANVRKTLSTVVEAASADEETLEPAIPNKEIIHLEDFEEEEEEDDDDEEEEEDTSDNEDPSTYDNLLLEALGTTDEASPRHTTVQSLAESPRDSENESVQDSNCEVDDEDIVNLEEALFHGPTELNALDRSVSAPEDADPERYESLEQEKDDEVQKELEDLSQQLQEYTIDVDETDPYDVESSATESDIPENMTSVAQSEDDSAAWALKDIASEETLQATGRTRHHFVVSGRRPSKKSRVIASLLSDDTSVQPSVAVSEVLPGLKEVEEEHLSSDDESSRDEQSAALLIPDQSEVSEIEELVTKATDDLVENVKETVVDVDPLQSDLDDIDVESNHEDKSESEDAEPAFIDEQHPHYEDVDEVEVMDEGVEITAPSSLIGQDEDSESVVEEREEESECSEAEFKSESEEGPAEHTNNNFRIHLAKDPSGELGRNVNPNSDEIRKPDPDAIGETTEKQRLEIDNKTLTIEEKDDEFDGKVVIHILTEESGNAISADESRDTTDGAETSVSIDGLSSFGPEEPAIEVGQGPLSPTRLTEFVSTVERQKATSSGHADQIKDFKKLIVPLVDGHKPTLVESAQIRQAAMKAGIDLGVVDEFLDYVDGDQTPVVSPATSSGDEQDLLVKSFEVSELNEDEAIADFLVRVEQAREAAAEAVAAAAAKAIMAAENEAAKAITEEPSTSDDATDADVYAEEMPLNSSNTFLEQFEELQLDEQGIEAVGSTSDVQVLASPTTSTLESHITGIESVDSLNVETRIDAPAFEVGQGLLSPTRLSEFLANVDKQHDGKEEPDEMGYFKNLIVPIVDGHKPTVVEVAQIRQAALKANVPLTFVDNFLDYVNDQDEEEQIAVAGSSIDGGRSSSFGGLDSMEDHNDDQAISAFLARVERARAAAEEAAVALEAEAEAALQVKATLQAQSDIEAISPRVNPFIKSFEELDMQEESSQDAPEEPIGERGQSYAPVVFFEENDTPLSPSNLGSLFAEIEHHHNVGNIDDVKIFQELIAPVVNGHKPSVIEEARIRQAALKAAVPLDLVDTFVGYVKNGHPDVASPASSKDPSLLLQSWEDVEDVNEDVAIAGFLSRFQSQKEALRKKALSHSIFEEKAIPPAEIIDVVVRDRSATMKVAQSTDVNSGIDGARSSKDISANGVKSGDEEEDPWWKHAGSPKAANATSFGSASEEWSAKQQSIDIEETNTESRSQAVESTRRRKKLSIDTGLVGSKSKVVQKFDEEVWRRRTAMATYGWNWEEATWLSPRNAGKGPAGIGGVTSVEGLSNSMFNKDSFVFARRNWSVSYKQRTREHAGYFDVNVNSLLESATFGEGHWPKDDTPWELRYVRQRFLHERSLTFSRNWFGTLEEVNGNDKIKAPVCKPKSMEMPMENIPEDGEWDVEWYTTWSARKHMPKPPPANATVATEGEGTLYESEYGSEESSQETGSYTDTSTYIEEDDDEWEDAPECGTIVNVKQKIGERVSRVHPDYTSSLRRSRWRKKYFPKGSFPY